MDSEWLANLSDKERTVEIIYTPCPGARMITKIFPIEMVFRHGLWMVKAFDFSVNEINFFPLRDINHWSK